MTVTLSFYFPDGWRQLDPHTAAAGLHVDDNLLAVICLFRHHVTQRLFQLAQHRRNEPGINRFIAHRIARSRG